MTSRGDPFGELIAIDLALSAQRTTTLVERKRELVRSWFGGDNLVDARWTADTVDHGLVRGLQLPTLAKHSLAEYVEQLVATVGNRIGDLHLYGGTNAEVEPGLEMLASQRLPWLTTLTVRRLGAEKPIARDVWDAVVAATPNLRELTLVGTGVVASPIHPAVRALRVYGPAVAIGREPVASVTELDVRFQVDTYGGAPPVAVDQLAAMVDPRAFPALRVLDVSWNEPPMYGQPTRPRVLAFLDAVERLDRIERVRVPSVDAESAAALIEILERCPRLTIEVARMYATLDVAHPRLRLPEPRVWPALHSREALTFELPKEGAYCTELALSSVIEALEWQYDAMPAAAREAWLAFWAFLDDLGWEDDAGKTIEKSLSADLLLTALEALDTDDRSVSIAASIRDARLPSGSMVTVSRYWGW